MPKSNPDPIEALVEEINANPPEPPKPSKWLRPTQEQSKEILNDMWLDDSYRYTMQELSILAYARYELSRCFKIPSSTLRQLEKIEHLKKWKEQQRTAGGNV